MKTPGHAIFVDDQPSVLEALRRSLRSVRNEWSLTFCSSAADALEHLAHFSNDVIVSDIAMPHMSGIELLTRVRETYPCVVRIALSGAIKRETFLEICGNVAHQFLPKPCSREALEQALERARSVHEILANDKLHQLVARVTSLPAMPSLHCQLLRRLNDADSSLHDVANIISRDPGLSVRILQLANSAYFGLSTPVCSIDQAVTLLGLDIIRSLAASAKLISQFNSAPPSGFSLDALWRHSIEVGRHAHAIARYEHADPEIIGQCMLAGMLHDAGKLVLATQLTAEYEAMLQEAGASNRSSWLIEQEFLGADHAQVGACLLELWGFDQTVCDAVRLSHEPACPHKATFSPSAAVWAANQFALSSMLHETIDIQSDGRLVQWKALNAASCSPSHLNRPLESEVRP